MKIAVFTPFVKTSAIAKVTNTVFQMLNEKRGIEVDIWTSHKGNLLETKLNIVQFAIENLIRAKLDKYDFCVYVMGNYAYFHRDCYLASRVKPGVIILHDQTQSSFWWSVYNHDTQPQLWLNEREMLFGELPEYHSQSWEEFMRGYNFIKMPYKVSLRPFVANAMGVFTHAQFFANYIVEQYNLPAGNAYIPLPTAEHVEADSTVEIGTIITRAQKQGRKIVVSTGKVHAVKRNDKVMAAIFRNQELRDNICYILIGENSGEYCARLIEHSQKELNEALYLLGHQPDSVMNKAIEAADICVNLRYPNSEVCSLSLLEQMAVGKAVLVTGTGIYGEVPDDAVLKLKLDQTKLYAPEFNYVSDDRSANYCDIEGELDAIESVLLKLARGELDLSIVGINAKAFVQSKVSKGMYADRFADYLETLPQRYQMHALQKRFLTQVKVKSEELFSGIEDFPHMVANLAFDIGRLFNRTEQNRTEQNRTEQNRTEQNSRGILRIRGRNSESRP
ncbi:MAG: glycosyltransferase [Clostridiales bacterium]|nr:glycosyltransferase [Clostridiales bacterium]